MPLPMIHLAIAVELGRVYPQCMSPAFLLGSIAPDSIHMRPNATGDDKQATHLIAEGSRFAENDDLHNLINQHHLAQPPLPLFTLGYVVHILTDNFWKQTVIDSFRAKLPQELDHAAYRRLYYQETDQLDFNLYHHAAWRPDVWDRLAAADAVDFPPLLTASEIGGWCDRTLRWFTELKEEPGIIPEYLTDSLAQDFVAKAAGYVGTHLRQWSVPH